MKFSWHPSLRHPYLIIAELPDAAMLDLSLGSEDAYAVADALNKKKIPFVFLTGHGANVLAHDSKIFRSCPSPSTSKTLRAQRANF